MCVVVKAISRIIVSQSVINLLEVGTRQERLVHKIHTTQILSDPIIGQHKKEDQQAMLIVEIANENTRRFQSGAHHTLRAIGL